MDNVSLKSIEKDRNRNMKQHYKTPAVESMQIMTEPNQNAPSPYYNNEIMRSYNTSEYKRPGYGRHDSNPTSLKNIAYQRQAMQKRMSQM